MIKQDRFAYISDEEKEKYSFNFCELCYFHDNCELINDYITGHALHNRTATDLPFYMKEIWENGGCPMQRLTQIECGSQWVADGIGDDFKIELKYSYETNLHDIVNKDDKWDPRQPVFISSQTGTGKNTFIDKKILPYVEKLNQQNDYWNENGQKLATKNRVLILSNRLALTAQTKARLKPENDFSEDEDNGIYQHPGNPSGNKYANVMSYQSLLNYANKLKRIQKSDSKYIFVICDECHFFTSDAMFNPDTEKILRTIVNTFSNAVRVYMSATPYESLKYILEKETAVPNHKMGIMYHFPRNYDYLNAKYFSNEDELVDIIIENAEKKKPKENWLIFIDNIEECKRFKAKLETKKNEKGESEATALDGKVITIDASSKKKDEKYQKMIVSELFHKNINVVLSTSVIDNGVNFRNVQNVVITDTNRTKCIQMVGRLRIDRVPNTSEALGNITMYIKKHHLGLVNNRLNDINVQQEAYHDYEMMLRNKFDKFLFLEKYYNNMRRDWENAKHWFSRDKKNPDMIYLNEIAKSLTVKYERIYESILNEMAKTEAEDIKHGLEYLEYQLSWFNKIYSKENDIYLNASMSKRLEFEEWIKEKWLGMQMSKEAQKSFGKEFFEKYYPLFGICTKEQGFSSRDNTGINGPKFAGYSIRRIKEIFQVRNMPFEVIEEEGFHRIIFVEQDTQSCIADKEAHTHESNSIPITDLMDDLSTFDVIQKELI